MIKPLVTADWWEKTLDLVGQMAREVPVYRLRFDKSERVLDALRPLLGLSIPHARHLYRKTLRAPFCQRRRCSATSTSS